MAPTPTMAMARCAVFSMMTFLFTWRVRLQSGGEADARSTALAMDGYFRELFCWTLLHAAVQNVSDVIHVGDEARLRAMNGLQVQRYLKRRNLRIGNATCTSDPTQSVLRHLQCCLAREDSADRGQRGRVKAVVGLLVEPAFGHESSAPGQCRGRFRVGDPLAYAQQDVLIAGQPSRTGLFHDLGESVQRQSRNVGSNIRVCRVQ